MAVELRRKILFGGLVFSIALGSLALRALAAHMNEDEPLEIAGVRLGMTASEVHERFQPHVSGRWRALPGQDPVLVWEPSTVTSNSQGQNAEGAARFEFHAGMLVAVRWGVFSDNPAAQGRALDVSTASVLSRRREGNNRVELTLLARDCPTHAEEAQRLLNNR